MFVGILFGLVTCLGPITLGLLLFLVIISKIRYPPSQSR